WAGFGAVPEAAVDHGLPLLRVTDAKGKLLAVVVNYACHCTTLRGNFRQIHGDWAGCAQQYIEADHPGAVAMICIGCGADADPYPHGTVELCRQHGRALADEVTRLLEGSLKPIESKLTARLVSLEIPYEEPPPIEELKRAAEKSHPLQNLLQRAQRGEKPPVSKNYQIAAWVFGDDLAMVFLADEVVVDYALRMKRELDGNRLWITAYTNDVSTYIVSKRLLDEGGYEVRNSLSSKISYGRPSQVRPAMEDRIISGVRTLLPKGFRTPPTAETPTAPERNAVTQRGPEGPKAKHSPRRDSQADQKLLLSNDFAQIYEKTYPDSKNSDILIRSLQSRRLCTISYFPVFVQSSSWAPYAEETHHIPIRKVYLEDGKLFLEGSLSNDVGPQWQVRDEIRLDENLISIRRQWEYSGERRGGVRLGFDLLSEFTDLDYWMIPGLMYNGNPGSQCQPAGILKDGQPWCFREERATVPSCIILESRKDVIATFTEPARDEDVLSFCCLIPSEEGHILRTGFPFVEAPLVYLGDNAHKGIYLKPSWAAGKALAVENGERFERTFYVVVDRAVEKRHGYIKPIDAAWRTFPDTTRSCYDLDTLEQICWKATSYHWYEDDKVSGFSARISNKGRAEKSRSPYFESGWCGVAFMMGHLLLKESVSTGNEELLLKAKAVADAYVKHAGLPNGMYWTHYNIVKREFVKGPCTTLQMAEGVYWLLKMNKLLSEKGREDEAWTTFARKHCDFLVRSQLPSGSFGEKWRPSGELFSDHRCGGVYAVATLVEAFKAFGDGKYLESAERGARYYIDFCVDKEDNYGICTDLSNVAIEMDGNAAVVFALLEIYEATKKPVYLEKAVKAAEFGLSFQYAYNIAFSSHTDAGRYKLDTRGAALITNEVPIIGYWVAWDALGFLRLWKHTGDPKWRERGVAAIKHTTHLMTTEEETFGCAPHLIGCRGEVLSVVDVLRVGALRKKGMVDLVNFEPVFWPAAFNLLNIVTIREKYPELIDEFKTP
ncbi:MAG: hypothetical protein GWP08_20615, partial [Nitrospiraceae bacterium]|nr:hypothetical protein [Nitrospiraceae bacterium]